MVPRLKKENFLHLIVWICSHQQMQWCEALPWVTKPLPIKKWNFGLGNHSLLSRMIQVSWEKYRNIFTCLISGIYLVCSPSSAGSFLRSWGKWVQKGEGPDQHLPFQCSGWPQTRPRWRTQWRPPRWSGFWPTSLVRLRCPWQKAATSTISW